MKMDEIDKKIIETLSLDGKQSAQQVAEHVGASSASCWRRIKALEDAGVIKGYHADIDHTALGLELTAFAQVTLNRHNKDNNKRFERDVVTLPEVVTCHSVTGQSDYILQVRVRNVRDYEELLNDRIFQLPGVQQVFSTIALKTVKSR